MMNLCDSKHVHCMHCTILAGMSEDKLVCISQLLQASIQPILGQVYQALSARGFRYALFPTGSGPLGRHRGNSENRHSLRKGKGILLTGMMLGPESQQNHRRRPAWTLWNNQTLHCCPRSASCPEGHGRSALAETCSWVDPCFYSSLSSPVLAKAAEQASGHPGGSRPVKSSAYPFSCSLLPHTPDCLWHTCHFLSPL